MKRHFLRQSLPLVVCLLGLFGLVATVQAMAGSAPELRAVASAHSAEQPLSGPVTIMQPTATPAVPEPAPVTESSVVPAPELPRVGDAGEILSVQVTPDPLPAGEQATFTIAVRNTGSSTWDPSVVQAEVLVLAKDGTVLADGWGADAEPFAPVGPGGEATITAHLHVPRDWQGDYRYNANLWSGATLLGGFGEGERLQVSSYAGPIDLAPDGTGEGFTLAAAKAPAGSQAVDIVFAMDTSGSMSDEFSSLCSKIGGVVADLEGRGLTVRQTVLGIHRTRECATGTVSGLIPSATTNHIEDWGPASYDLAAGFGWAPGYVRLIVPMSDEGPENGDSCYDPGEDRDSISLAIAAAQANNVRVGPVLGTGYSSCVQNLAADLATGTGGRVFYSTDPSNDLADGIMDLIGGVVARSWVQVDPKSVSADSVTSAQVTVRILDKDSQPADGRQVRLSSSRGQLDTIGGAIGTTDASGQYVTTIRSGTPGVATLRAKDLTTGQPVIGTATIQFTALPGQEDWPPGQPPPILITAVSADYRLDGLYPSNLPSDLWSDIPGFYPVWAYRSAPDRNRVRVTVDWKGLQPGWVDILVDGQVVATARADISGAELELDMVNGLGTNGPARIQIQARTADGLPSQTVQRIATAWELSPAALTYVEAMLSETLFTEDDVILDYDAANRTAQLEIKLAVPNEDIDKLIELFPGAKFGAKGVQLRGTLVIPIGGSEIEVVAGVGKDGKERPKLLGSTGGPNGGSFVLGKAEAGIEVSGYGTADVRPDGTLVWRTMGARIVVEATYTEQYSVLAVLNFVPGPGQALYAVARPFEEPLRKVAHAYWSVSGKLGGEAEVDLEDLEVVRFAIISGLGLEIGAKVDITVFTAELAVGLETDVELLLIPQRCVELEAAGYARACWGFGILGGKECREGRVTLGDLSSDPSGSCDPSLRTLAFSGPVKVTPWRLPGHGYRGAYSQFELATGQGAASPQDSETLLVSNVFTYTRPSMAANAHGSEAVLTWVHDDIARPLGQNLEIAFSHWDGASWHAPSLVTGDSFFDNWPHIAWSDGKYLLAWQRIDDPALPPTTTAGVTTYKKIEIATAIYDPVPGTWSTPAWLTQDDALDYGPRVAGRAADGSAAVAWLRNEHGALPGTKAHPDQIMAAVWNGASWSPPIQIIDGLTDLVDYSIAIRGTDKALLVYAREITASNGVSQTAVLYTSTWNGVAWTEPFTLTDDELGNTSPQAFYRPSGAPAVAFLSESRLTMQDLATSERWQGDHVPDGAFSLAQDAGGNLYAVWASGHLGGLDLYGSYFDAALGLWAAPVQLTDALGKDLHPSVAFVGPGETLLTFARTASVTETQTITNLQGVPVSVRLHADGQTDLHSLRHSLGSDLEPVGLEVSDRHPAAGDTVVFSATLSNAGELPVAGATLAFYDGDPGAGGQLIDQVTVPSPLGGGYTATISIAWLVPETGFQHRIYAVADPDGLVPELDENNNQAMQVYFGPDLTITGAGVESWAGTTVGLVTQIQNLGTTQAPTTTVAFYWEALTGTLAITGQVPSLAAGSGITLTTPWDYYGALGEGIYDLAAIVNQDQVDFAETFTTNNTAHLALGVLPDLAVDAEHFWSEHLPDGQVVITGTVFNFGGVPVRDAVVAVYANDPLNDTNRLFTSTIPYLPPGGYERVSGTWAAPPADYRLFLRADPAAQIPETTRANNLANMTAGFLLEVEPSDQPAVRGRGVVFDVTLDAYGGFGAEVTLSVAGLPADVENTILPNPSIPPGSVRVIITPAATTALGYYPFEIRASGGGYTLTRPVILKVSLGLDVTVVGQGQVAVDPPPPYAQDDLVSLQPQPDPGWRFDGWSGRDIGSLTEQGDGTWTMTMNGDKALTATFAREFYSVTVTTSGLGQVSHTPGNPYTYQMTATLEPVPGAGWVFQDWGGPDAGDLVYRRDGTWTLLVDADKAVGATFQQAEYSLQALAQPVQAGRVEVEPARDTYYYGDTLLLRPVAYSGWRFVSWMGPNAGELVDQGNGTWGLIMTNSKSVVAVFHSDTWDIYLPQVMRRRFGR